MITVGKDYLALTKRLPLIPIRDDNHLREANLILIELSGKKMTIGELDYFRVLSRLTGDYEEARFPIEPMLPVEAFEYLMEENGLTRAQMGEIIGCQPNRVSEILSGVRELSKKQIARLSARFKISSNLFLSTSLKKAS
jgi:HTH-type transcriptional regulator / antitoxin HigA